MSAEQITAVGRDVECVVLARAVRWHVERRVLMNGHKCVVFRLVGLAAIRDSFEQVFSHGPVPARPEQVVRLHHGDFALHHLVEVIEPPAREAAAGEAGGGKPQRAWVLATNVYRRTPLGWRMVAHHASPSLPPAGGPTAAPSTLH
jgi:ketosteroid isomerase-like protein